MSDTSLLFNLLAVDRATEKILGVKSAFGLLAVGVAAGAATFAEKSVKMAADFESSTTRLITSAGETHQNIDMVRKGMLDMAGQVGNSAQDLAKAMYIVESGGRHGAEGLQVLRAAAEGAKAEGADLTTVADALTSVLQDYHLKGSDAALVTSQMVAAVGAGKTTFEQFAGSLHSVLPIASSAHVSFVDISAALASMTVHGMSAEQASQNLNDVLQHMNRPTGVMTAELGQLGMSSSDLSGMLGKRGLTGTLQDLSQLILSHMGPSGKVMLDAFNQSKDAARDANAMVAAMPPNLANLAREFQANKITLGDWRKDLKALPPEQANLLQQFAALQNHASGFSNVLKAGGPAAQNYQDALARVTGDATGLNVALMLTGENTAYVNAAVKAVGGATTEAGNHVRGFADMQNTFNQKLSEAKGYLGALTIQIGSALLPVAKDLMTATMDTVSWFSKHKTVAQDLGTVIGTLAGGMLLYKTSLLVVSAATKTWTVVTTAAKGAVLAARGAVAAWAAVQGLATSTLGTWIGVQALDFAAWVRKAATVTANTAGLVAYTVATTAVKVATVAWTAVQWLLNIAFIASPIGWIVLGIGLLVAAVIWIATKTTWFQTIWKWAWGGIKEAAGATVNWTVAKFNAFVGFFTGLPSRISSIASRMWDGLTGAFKGAINFIIHGWNSLHFGIPQIDTHIPGIGVVGGGSFGVPQIPYLAAGGVLTRGGLVTVGERGAETVALPAGSAVYPHGSGPGGGEVRVVVELHAASGDQAAEAILRVVRPVVRGRYGGDVKMALGGAA